MRSNVSEAVLAATVFVALNPMPARAQAEALPTPEFHHLHLNSVNPEAAIDFYSEQFPSTSRTTFAGEAALWSPTDVLILFDRVETPPPTQPQTAFWHFGWHVTNVQESVESFRRNGVTLLPLYTERHGATVFSSGDTWPGSGGVGLTAAGIAEARAGGVQPSRGAGFAYVRGPDDAVVEYQGDRPQERFNHLHLYMEQPFCALLWYRRHLNVPARGGSGAASTEDDCRVARGSDPTWPALDTEGTYRTPSMNSIAFSDVSLYAYMNQTDVPLASTRGQLMDHFGLRVDDLDAWIAKLRADGVTFLEEPYRLGEHRAIMIEGPSREAIELIEVRP
jgi:catechol 2,3-dioxygenase-like lactoylglutathione lyase family enzyme